MTPKEALQAVLRGEYAKADEVIIEALEKQAISEETSDKYRWHDLRKDPNDLPEIDPDLLPISKRVYFSTKDDAYTGTYDHLLETWDSDGLEEFEISGVVIAWREIEHFEEVEE